VSHERHSPLTPAGERTGLKTRLLARGADLLQTTAPLKHFDVYVVGFHCAKADPQMQMEAHHFCRQVNDELLQCVIFDGNTEDANLIGIEYIVSERLFEGLPAEEKPYWHPHNFELLGGSLIAPGLPDAAERAYFELLMNSYGKTWHTWHTGRHDGKDAGTPLPYGDAMLMWSFNREGETDPSLEEDRDRAMGLSTTEKRAARKPLTELAHPQHGVNALRDAFPDAAPSPPPGVRDVEDAG
jgi:hypothetical protein